MIIRLFEIHGKIGWVTGIILVIICCSACINQESNGPDESLSEIQKWEMLGKRAAIESLNLIQASGAVPETGNIAVLTNAGYAEVGGSSTEGALDGVATVTGASGGRKLLIDVHTALWNPLWFAVYDPKSGLRAYFQVDAIRDLNSSDPLTVKQSELFSRQAVEKINSSHPYAHAADFKSTFERNPSFFFGYQIVAFNSKVFKMADMEKAVLDFFYLHPELKSESDINSLRFNEEAFKQKFNRKKLQNYLKKFAKNTLSERVAVFLELMMKHGQDESSA